MPQPSPVSPHFRLAVSLQPPGVKRGSAVKTEKPPPHAALARTYRARRGRRWPQDGLRRAEVLGWAGCP